MSSPRSWKTYRYFGHSVSDAGLYRSKEEVEGYRQQDPIGVISKQLIDSGKLSEAEVKQLVKAAKTRVEEALEFADESPEPPASELMQAVYQDNLD
jgi:pyruvate dehydrogenase E1 component alpha subunit